MPSLLLLWQSEDDQALERCAHSTHNHILIGVGALFSRPSHAKSSLAAANCAHLLDSINWHQWKPESQSNRISEALQERLLISRVNEESLRYVCYYKQLFINTFGILKAAFIYFIFQT